MSKKTTSVASKAKENSKNKKVVAFKPGMKKEPGTMVRTKESKLLLTMMQTKIVRLAALGCDKREISNILGIAESTVDNHKAAAMKALGIKKATIMVLKAIELGIIKASDRLTPTEKRDRLTPEDKFGKDGWN